MKTNYHKDEFYLDLSFSLWASPLLSEIALQGNVILPLHGVYFHKGIWPQSHGSLFVFP